MSEKVKLPKDVCNALDHAMGMNRNFDYTIAEMTRHGNWEIKECEILNNQNVDVIMRALVLGYEAELSAEDVIKNIYTRGYVGHDEHSEAFRYGIKQALLVHGIHYDWMDSE